MEFVCFRRIATLLLAILLLLMAALPVCAADNDGTDEKQSADNRFNVVFVTDVSGSMAYNDTEKLRYEAIKRFVALLPDSGNYVGAVAFHSSIVNTKVIGELSGTSQKLAFMDDISQNEDRYQTNIGAALDEAITMLEESRNPALPSVILLLSDGKTELKTDEEINESIALRDEAVQRAVNLGVRIFAISLNQYGNAKNRELSGIASTTGGEFCEVCEATDLEGVEEMFYRLIFDTLNGPEYVMVIGDNGASVEESFTVPPFGVEELNIIVEGSISDLSLIQPGSDQPLTMKSLEDRVLSGKGFSCIKIVNPAGGEWKVTAYGNPNAKLSFHVLYNHQIRLTTEVDDRKEYHVGDSVEASAVIADAAGNQLNDPDKYRAYTCLMTVNGEETEMSVSQGRGFTAAYRIPETGTYYLSFRLFLNEGGERQQVAEGSEYRISVDNLLPVVSMEIPEIHARIWPWGLSQNTLDLTPLANDPDGDPITFSIQDSGSTYDEESRSLSDGGALTVTDLSTFSRGRIQVLASDGKGGEVPFEVTVSSVNCTAIGAGIIGALGVAVLVAAIMAVRKLNGKPFYGVVWLAEIDENGKVQPYHKCEHSKGSFRLEEYGAYINVNMDPTLKKIKVQAGGMKNKKIQPITLRSSKPFWIKGSKLVKIVPVKIDGEDKRVYATKEESQKGGPGISVMFTDPSKSDGESYEW